MHGSNSTGHPTCCCCDQVCEVAEGIGQGSAIVKRLLKGVENEPCVSRAANPPADDPTSIGVDHERDVDEARPGGNIGEVRDPQHVRPCRLELTVDPIQRTWRSLIADRRPYASSAYDALKTHRLHQPCDRAPRHILALPYKLLPDLADAIDLKVLFEDAPDLPA